MSKDWAERQVSSHLGHLVYWLGKGYSQKGYSLTPEQRIFLERLNAIVKEGDARNMSEEEVLDALGNGGQDGEAGDLPIYNEHDIEDRPGSLMNTIDKALIDAQYETDLALTIAIDLQRQLVGAQRERDEAWNAAVDACGAVCLKREDGWVYLGDSEMTRAKRFEALECAQACGALKRNKDVQE